MSMDRCQQCSNLVDTDDDPECYIQPMPDGSEKELDGCRCESCRESYYEDKQHYIFNQVGEKS